MFTTQSLINPLGPYLLKRLNPKIILLIGGTIMSVSIFLASYQTNWGMFIFLYAICFPTGIGMVYWVPIICGWEWFPERKGLVTGLIVGGYGFGAFIFGFITTAIANPDNLSPSVPQDGSGDQDKLFPKEVGDRVPYMLRFCLIFWVVFVAISILTVSRNPDFQRMEMIKRRYRLLTDSKNE
jgi:MFS family permease